MVKKASDVMEHIIDHATDIAFVTETWLTSQFNDVTAKVSTRNYDLKHVFRKDGIKKSGGGVGILCPKKYRLRTIKSLVYESFEHGIFSLTKNKHDKLVLVAVYRLQHMPFSLFLQEFPSLLESLCSMNCLLLIGGDMNIHLNNDTDQHCHSFLSLLDSFNLHQLVTETTHKRGNLLDVLITNEPGKCHNVKVLDVGLSDHYLITGTIDYNPHTVTEYKTITFRKLKEIDLDAFSADLHNHILSCDLHNENEFGTAVLSYNAALAKVLDTHAPLITKTIKDVPRAPWFDREYTDLRRKRRRAEKLYRQTKLMVHKLEFVRLRTLTTALAARKKVTFCRSNINDAPNTTKALYSTVNKLIGIENKPVFPTAESDKDLANEFGAAFTAKVNKIRHNIEDKVSTNISENFPLCHSAASFTSLSTFDPATDHEIRDIIQTHGLKCGFSDPLPEPLIKLHTDLLVPVWTHLVNLSLQSGTIDNLKHADIIPILKAYDLDPELHSNFRPVSNLQFLGKLIERIVLKRLNKHILQNNLDIPNQYGYKPAHSTESILIKISNDILIASDKKTATVLLLLDFSAAFDTVDIHILLDILCREIGITGVALDWFRSFLTNRTMRVKINNSYSDVFLLEFGVPQGSVLGPVLFSIYVRSIYKYVESSGFCIKGFADDHQLYVSFTPNFQFHYLGHKINDVLEKVTKWADSFFLKLNPNKTQIIVFGPKSIKDDIHIKGTFIEVDNSCIRFSNVVKNLGVLFDSDMSFSAQVNSVVSSTFMNIKKISRIKSFLTVKEKNILMCSLVLSKLDYCNSLYYGINNDLLSKLQYAQNCAARLIYQRRKFDHVTDIFMKLHWLPVPMRIIYKVLTIVHKCLYQTSPVEINSLITFESTRTFNLQIPRCHMSHGDRAFGIYSAKEWNKLPLYLKTETSVKHFKKHLKTYLYIAHYGTTT